MREWHGGTKNVAVPKAERERFCLTDSEVLKLAGDAIGDRNHYSRSAGHPMPMDIEWAKDAERWPDLHHPGAARDRDFTARADFT